MNGVDIPQALTFFVVFLFSTTLHEAAHAWTALKGGDSTAYAGGQVSLDPRPHIKREPFGMVVLPLLTSLLTGWPMGYASAPYNVGWALTFPRRAALMALAGPAANLVLAVCAGVALRVGEMTGVFYPPEVVRFGALAASDVGPLWSALGVVLSVVFSMNILLFVFNLIPFPPLDGSAVITLFMDARTTRRYQEFIFGTPQLAFVGIFISWKLLDVIFAPVFFGLVNLIYAGASYG